MYRPLSKNCCLLQSLLGVLLVVGMSASPHSVWAEEETSLSQFPEPVPDFIDDAMRYLGLDDSYKKDLLAGKVLFSGMPDMEVLDEQLTVAGVMLVINRPMHEIVELILAGQAFRANDKIIDVGLISDELSTAGVTLSSFRNIHFTQNEKNEINRLLQVGPGAEYNFSKGELARFRALQASPDNAIKAVSTLYRDILLQRFQTYMQNGIQGIADYQRGGDSAASPSKELAIATDTAWFLKKHFPDFHQVIVSFPGSTQEGIRHRFYWMKKIVDQRPHLALSHSTIQVSENYAIALDVHYYASHSYNAIHTLVGLVPFNENTLVLSSNRTFTDKVLGFASSQKRKVGRRIVAKLMADKFTNLKKMLESGPVDND